MVLLNHTFWCNLKPHVSDQLGARFLPVKIAFLVRISFENAKSRILGRFLVTFHVSGELHTHFPFLIHSMFWGTLRRIRVSRRNQIISYCQGQDNQHRSHRSTSVAAATGLETVENENGFRKWFSTTDCNFSTENFARHIQFQTEPATWGKQENN